MYPIGTNRATSKGANGWEATAIMGEFSSSLAYMSSSDAPLPKIKGTLSALHNIPQVECEMNFTMSVGLYGKDKYLSQDYDSSEIAEDNTFIKLTTKPLILHLLEKMVFLTKIRFLSKFLNMNQDPIHFLIKCTSLLLHQIKSLVFLTK